MHRAPAVLVLAFFAFPRVGWSQVGHHHGVQEIPVGPEFAVNTYVAGDQRGAFVTSTFGYPGGQRVLVWTSDGQDGSGLGVFGRAYPGSEFRVNTYTTGDQSEASVAGSTGTSFIVVWSSQDGSGPGVFGQRYAAAGVPLGPEFRVNTFTTGWQSQPRVASDVSGKFVVVWRSDNQDGSAAGVFGQRYDASGVPLGAEFPVNTYTSGYQYNPSVSADPAGSNFVVVWQDGTAPGGGGGQPGRGVFGQRYSSAGVPLGPEFQVETYTTGFQGAPAVVVQPGGSFVVAWHSDGQDGSGLGIFAHRFASAGAPYLSEFRVNADTTGPQAFPTLATDAVGCFFVAWTGPDGSGTGIFGQSYVFGDPTAEPQYRVNTFTTGSQARSTASVDPSYPGTFVIAWDSQGQDGSGYGVFAQIDNHFIPVELMTFEVE